MQIAWPYPICKNRNRHVQIYFHLLNEYYQFTCTRNVGLSNSMVQPMNLRRVLKKFFLVDHCYAVVHHSRMCTIVPM